VAASAPKKAHGVRVVTRIKRLDDGFGDYLVRVVCECGTCRKIQPQALCA
jgi:hypothetical protein